VRVLVAGDWHSSIHEEPVKIALVEQGHECVPFAWHTYFRSGAPGPAGALSGRLLRAQNAWLYGPAIARLNRDLVALARRTQPDAVLVYRGTHVWGSTLRKLRTVVPGAPIVGLNNDNPFSELNPPLLWRHFLAAIPAYDLILAYREGDIPQYRAHGARDVRLFRSWFLPWLHHPFELGAADREKYECEVVFAGHYEPDGRKEQLEAIIRAGHRLKLFGPGWEKPAAQSPWLRQFTPVISPRDVEYCKALRGAKIALCYLSKLNRDTYTRRCFEIPALGTMLLSEYTDDLATMFDAGAEADFFRTDAELLEKLAFYLSNDDERRRVARGGRDRVVRDGHDVFSRVRELISSFDELRGSRVAARGRA